MRNCLPVILYFYSCIATLRTMQIRNKKDEIMYLKEYGYIKDGSLSPDVEKQGIRMFQHFVGIRETGKFDRATKKKMNMPRCGNKESMNTLRNEEITRKTRKTKGWRYSDIHYRINNFPRSGLSPEVVRENVRRAFEFWEQVADIVCIEVHPSDNRHVEIDISFETDEHGDGHNFGRSGIGEAVAHTFFPEDDPELEGDIHFDDERGWTVNTIDGINFFQLCVHEIGHALGLEHSMVKESVMYMLVNKTYNPNFKLHQDDIHKIRNLYGRNVPPTPKPPNYRLFRYPWKFSSNNNKINRH